MDFMCDLEPFSEIRSHIYVRNSKFVYEIYSSDYILQHSLRIILAIRCNGNNNLDLLLLVTSVRDI